jgi:HlyD family secretion protein
MRISYIIIPLLIGAGAYGWYWKNTHPDIISVTVVKVEKGDVESTVANTRAGTVMACRRAKMSPSIGGQISELPYKEGNYVRKGAILLKVWNDDLRAEILHAKNAIAAAKDRASASCLQADLAIRKAERSKRLLNSKAISQEAYDQSITEAQMHNAECKAAQANVKVAFSDLNVTKARLERTVLYAPFDGVIAQINGELNEYVTPSPPGILTPTIVDLIEPGCFYVTVPIDEVDAPKVKKGMPVRITLDAWRGRVFEGVVRRIGSYIIDYEKQARTVDIELDFNNKKDLDDLLVGYSADADVILETNKDVLRIPSEALEDDTHVLLFNPVTSKLEKKPIKKGLNNWSYTEILEGLNIGDQLVTSLGTEGVKEGALVKITVENLMDKKR